MAEFKRKAKYMVIRNSQIDSVLLTEEERQAFLKLSDKLIAGLGAINSGESFVVISSQNEELFDFVWKEIEATWLKDEGQFMQAAYQRVVNEVIALDIKIEKLSKFLSTEYYVKLSGGAQLRLIEQLDYMRGYSATLHARILGDFPLLNKDEGSPVSFENQKE